jgi:predicted RNase H-like HicB family nuclease
MPNRKRLTIPAGILKAGTLNDLIKEPGLTMHEFSELPMKEATAFPVLVFDAEEGGYWAKVPELPGCVSQGEPLEEVEAAILAVLESMQESGEALPKARRWEITVSPEELEVAV